MTEEELDEITRQLWEKANVHCFSIMGEPMSEAWEDPSSASPKERIEEVIQYLIDSA